MDVVWPREFLNRMCRVYPGLLFMLVICVSWVAMLASPGLVQAKSNPFSVGREEQEEVTAEPIGASPFGKRDVASNTTPESLFVMPGPLRSIFRQVAKWQREINNYLARQLRDASQQGGMTAAVTVIFASFIYGVLHAAGPGHGKMIVASYFTAREAPLRNGIVMGGIIALTQAVVAILMVTILAMALGGSNLEIMDRTNLLELASYGLILCIGLYMLYGALTSKTARSHHNSAEDEDNEQHDHHGHSHGPDPNARETWLASRARHWLGPQGELIAIGMISGVRPCTGSILVLLFAAANSVFLLGIIAALMIAAGVAITISVLGIGAIVLRQSVAGRDPNKTTPIRALLARSLSVLGSLAVAILGALLFGGALERTGLFT
ncbi:MAG: nickel/cobalt transporter [Rhodospirillaceae bacterium]